VIFTAIKNRRYALGSIPDGLASDRTDVLAKIQQIVQRFNSDGHATSANLMPSLAIVDDLPPFHFQGPTASSDWERAFSAEAENTEITEHAMRLLDATYLNVAGNRAYAVVPAVFSFKRRDEAIQQSCIVTAVLEKHDGDWRIAAWVWTRQ
jgi:hypothetical protein